MTWGRLARFWTEPPPSAWRSSQPPPSDPIQLGEAAGRLLDDPTLHLALGRIEERLIRKWRETATVEVAQREEAFRLLWAIEELKAELRLLLGNARGEVKAKERVSGVQR